MFQLIGLLGNVVFGVVDSNNKRDVEIVKDNNKSRIEISKVLLEGTALVGTLALSAYYHHTSNKPTQPQSKSELPLISSGSTLDQQPIKDNDNIYI